ncbi:MAG: ATP-binding protein [Phototrophicaceae bacterium]|jgi:PAS domain S-box-containing protein
MRGSVPILDTDNLIRQNQFLTQEVKRQTHEVKRRVDQMTALNLVATTVSQSLDLDHILTVALKAVTSVTGMEAGGISLLDEHTGDVFLRAQLGWEQNFTNPPRRIPAGMGISGQVIREDRLMVITDLQHRDDLAIPSFRDEPFSTMVMTPMHAGGRIIGILSLMSRHFNDVDESLFDLLGVVADTVAAALDNARLYKKSQENQNRLSAILQSTADGIIATGVAGNIQLMNPSAEQMLGVRAQTLLNTLIQETHLPETLCAPLRSLLHLHLEDQDRSFSVKLEGGGVLMAFVSPVYGLANEHDGWVIVLQDVTHLRAAEETRMQFVQAAAHDMRNPLGVTMTSLGTLQSLVEDELALEVIDVALSGVNRMQQLLDDLLHLERIESGYAFNISEIDITELLYEVVAQQRALFEEKSQQCVVKIKDRLGHIPIDPHWISRALVNYLSNANKYTPQGGQIRVKAFIEGDFVHIEVKDNGLGIPHEVQSRLFERFYRVKNASKERGSGLGLAIVKSVVEGHGGQVYMRSKVGEGSTFGMMLPRRLS